LKKRIASTILTGLFLISSSMPAFASNAKADIKIVIDGQQETYTDAPMMQNNHVLLPLRAVVTKLGFQDDNEHIVWNAAEKSVTLNNENTQIYLRVGSQVASVDDNPISLSTASLLSKNGKTYVPADFFKQILGKQVTWDASTQSVLITTGNKEKVTAVLKSFETGDPAAMEKWISSDKYIQHNLGFPSGRETVIEAIKQLKGAGVTYDIKRVIEDGDYVVAHAEVNLFGAKKAVFDIFRFENGKIVEHWDNLQDLAGPNPSGHTLVDGATEVKDLDKTEANKALINQFFEDVFMGKNPAAFPTYYDGDNYIQHNPMIGDGVSTVLKAFAEFAKSDVKFSYVKVHKVIGEGNFVLIVGEASSNGTSIAVYDLFRVENGKIAEHWDIIEPIPPKDQWKNENGKF
jgi:predicted SnoaL-like aldol condensation-catalyzing enzyme